MKILRARLLLEQRYGIAATDANVLDALEYFDVERTQADIDARNIERGIDPNEDPSKPRRVA